MNTPLFRAVWWSLPALVLLIGLAAWNPRNDFWGLVEEPKAQCEAYDAAKLASLVKPTREVYSCEKLTRLIREPQDTVSNLAYATVGLALCLAGRRREAFSLGVACLFLGVGSGLYHASLAAEWRLIDILGVYTALYGLIVLGLKANWPVLLSGSCGWLLDFAAWVLAIITGIYRNDARIAGIKLFDSTYVVVAAVALGCLLVFGAARRITNTSQYRRAVLLLALSVPVAFVGGQGDRFGGLFAAPDAWVQGHAVWHVLGAVAILSVYEAFAATGTYRSTLEP